MWNPIKKLNKRAESELGRVNSFIEELEDAELSAEQIEQEVNAEMDKLKATLTKAKKVQSFTKKLLKEVR